MAPSTSRRAALSCALLLLGGCVFVGEAWYDVEPRTEHPNPCYEANLLDGLDEDDPAELENLFDCFNLHGGFDPLSGIVEALVTSDTRSGKKAALELARAVNLLPSVLPEQVDLVEMVRSAAVLLQEENVFLVHVVRTLAEWAYGVHWAEVDAAFADGGGRFLDPDAVADGLLQPFVPILGSLAASALDSDDIPEISAALGELLTMPESRESITTLSLLIQEHDGLFAHMPEDFGTYLQAAPAADGSDTLITLVKELSTPRPALGGAATLTRMLRPVDSILDDEVASARLVDALGQLFDEELLQPLPGQLHSLLTIKADGTGAYPGQRSALESLIILLARADVPVHCPLILDTDSFSVWILQRIAAFDADTVGGLIELSEGLVDVAVGVGGLTCQGIDPSLSTHYPSLVRLAESGALESLIPLLRALSNDDPGHDRVHEIVELMQLIDTGDVMPALAEHLLQELDQPFMGNVFAIVGAYVSPGDPSAEGDIYSLLALANFLVSPPPGEGAGRSPLGLFVPPLRQLIEEQEPLLASWLRRWAILLRADGSATNRFLYFFAPLLEIDPDLDLLAGAGAVLGNAEIVEAMFRVLDSEPVLLALASSTSGSSGEEGLIGMIGRFSADGSLEALLSLLNWTAATLESVGLLR